MSKQNRLRIAGALVFAALLTGTQAQAETKNHAGVIRAGTGERVSEQPAPKAAREEELQAGPIHCKFVTAKSAI